MIIEEIDATVHNTNDRGKGVPSFDEMAAIVYDRVDCSKLKTRDSIYGKQ